MKQFIHGAWKQVEMMMHMQYNASVYDVIQCICEDRNE